MNIQGYIMLFIGFIAMTMILYLPIAIFMKNKGVGFVKQANRLLLFYSFFFIVFVTVLLFQLPISFAPERHTLNLQPLKWIWEGNIINRITTEISPNVIIFMPLGFFLPMANKRMRRFYWTALVVFGVTFCIELFQYFIGRSSDIDDLIANLLGGILGYMIFKTLDYLLVKKSWWVKIADIKQTEQPKENIKELYTFS